MIRDDPLGISMARNPQKILATTNLQYNLQSWDGQEWHRESDNDIQPQ